VVVGETGTVAAGLLELLAAHRAWERFAPVSTV
jgi:N-acetyl-gamma-glutamylphosphate reductase